MSLYRLLLGLVFTASQVSILAQDHGHVVPSEVLVVSTSDDGKPQLAMLAFKSESGKRMLQMVATFHGPARFKLQTGDTAWINLADGSSVILECVKGARAITELPNSVGFFELAWAKEQRLKQLAMVSVTFRIGSETFTFPINQSRWAFRDTF